MNYIIDENVPEKLIDLLKLTDWEENISSLKDHFETGTDDPEWLKALSSWEDKPVVISFDQKIVTNHIQRYILKECKLHFVYLKCKWFKIPWRESKHVIICGIGQCWFRILKTQKSHLCLRWLLDRQ